LTTTTQSGIRLAKRMDQVVFSDLVVVRNQIMNMQLQGIKVHALHGGEPFYDTPETIKYAAMKALIEGKTRYTDSSGILELRQMLCEKLARKNKMDVDPSEIIGTSGGSQGLYVAFQAVLGPEDDILVFSPFWTSIEGMVGCSNARMVLVPTDECRAEGFIKTLEKYSCSRTRAIYFNTPQNPSGLVFTREETEAVASFAISRDLVVVADEAYEDLVYEGEHVSIASLPGMAERTITCFTFSKTYAMTGLRAGYNVAKNPFMDAFRKIVLYSTNGVVTPVQYGMMQGLRMPDSAIADYREQYRQRRDLLVAGLNSVGMTCAPPAGAFYVFPDATVIHKDSKEAARLLLEKAHVSSIPGAFFGIGGEGHVRLCYAATIQEIEESVDALRKAFA
jgi:aspartate/methionine/tyrosine aminotransferase